jgi:uncharacterized protein (DUF362 family)
MKSTVVIERVENPKERNSVVEAVIRALNQIKFAAPPIPKGARVVIKPNMAIDGPAWEKGIVTSPLTVEGVVRYVQQFDPKEVIIGEAVAVGLNTMKGFHANGMEEVASRTGASLLDLNEGEFMPVPVPQGTVAKNIRVSKTILEAEYLINVPSMKTHVATGVSLGVKNLKGTIPPIEKKRSHFLGVSKFIMDLSTVVKPQLCLIDGSIAMEGDGPVEGTPVHLGIFVAGTDLVATDLVSTRIMGMDPWQIKKFKYAKEQNIGNWHEEDITIIGPPLKEVAKNFKPALGKYPPLSQISVMDGGACEGCREGLRIALGRMQAQGLLDKIPLRKILIGEKAYPGNDQEPFLALGRCLQKYDYLDRYIPGCPPQIYLITDELRQLVGQKRIFGDKKEFFKGVK